MQAVLPWTRVFDNAVMSAFLAVDVFFMLSGFVLSYNYAERFARFGRREYRGYFVSRFARIYPVYVVTLLFTGVVIGWFALTDRDLALRGFVSNFFMLQTMPGGQSWNMPSWSVACEVGAYLVFPFVASALLRLGWRTALALAVVEVVLLVGAMKLMFAVEGGFPINLYFWTRLVVGFSLGCLAWVVWRRVVRRHRVWDVVALVALAATALVVHLRHQAPMSYIVVGLLAVLVVACASATGPVRAVLASRALRKLGETSYSVYLVHYPLFVILFALMPLDGLRGAPLVARVSALAVFFLLPLVVGGAIFRYLEEPARHWIRRRLSRRPAPSAAPTAGASPERMGRG